MNEAIEILEKRLEFLKQLYSDRSLIVGEVTNCIALLRAADAGIVTRVGHNFVPAPVIEDVPF